MGYTRCIDLRPKCTCNQFILTLAFHERPFQQQVYDAAFHLEPAISPPNPNTRGWRNDPGLFTIPDATSLKSGTLNMSPAWYASGWEVRKVALLNMINNIDTTPSMPHQRHCVHRRCFGNHPKP